MVWAFAIAIVVHTAWFGRLLEWWWHAVILAVLTVSSVLAEKRLADFLKAAQGLCTRADLPAPQLDHLQAVLNPLMRNADVWLRVATWGKLGVGAVMAGLVENWGPEAPVRFAVLLAIAYGALVLTAFAAAKAQAALRLVRQAEQDIALQTARRRDVAAMLAKLPNDIPESDDPVATSYGQAEIVKLRRGRASQAEAA